MIKVRTAAALLATTALILALAAPAQAATQVFHASEKGQEVSAFFGSVSGCIETDVIVLASQTGIHNAPGAPSQQTSALVSVARFDICSHTFIDQQFGTATIPDSALQVRGNHVTETSNNGVFVLKFHGASCDSTATGTITEGSTTVASGTTAVAEVLSTDGFSLNVDRS